MINVVVIGLGIMGRRMLTSMTAHGGFHFVGCWDPSEAACQQAREEFAGLAIGTSAEELISAAETQLVYIACPPLWHKHYADLAIAAGKAVYCEKPLGIDLDESAALVDSLKAGNVPNVVNFAQASSRAAARIDEAIRSGEMGEVTGVGIIVHFARWPRDWQADAEWLKLGDQGGYTREVLSHWLYLTERFLGRAELVSATPVYPEDPALCESHISAVLDCSGVPVQVTGSSNSVGPDRVEMCLWGTKKSFRLYDWFNLQSTDGGDWREELAEFGDLRADGSARQMNSVAAWIKGEEHPLASAEDALSVQVLIEAMLEREEQVSG